MKTTSIFDCSPPVKALDREPIPKMKSKTIRQGGKRVYVSVPRVKK